LKRHQTDFGYKRVNTRERDMYEAFDIDSGEEATERYIDARRMEFYEEYYSYLSENGVSPYFI